MDSPASQEDKLDLVTRFIRDIRRVARKLGEGGAPFSELQDLYQLAEVFQTNETDEDLFSIRFQLWQTVKHTYRVIAPCGIGGDGPPWSTVLELLKEAELLAKVGNAKRRVKRHRSRFPHSGPLPSSLLGDSALSHTPSHDYQSHSTPFQSRSLPQLYNRADLVGLEDSSTPHPSQIQHTERGPAAYHQHPGPRHFSDDTSYHYFPSERSHIDISHSQRSRLPAGERHANSTKLSLGPPPLVARPEPRCHRPWRPSDNCSYPSYPPSTHPNPSRYSSSVEHTTTVPPMNYAQAYRRDRPVSCDSPPLPRHRPSNWPSVPQSRSTTPTERSTWPLRSSNPDVSEGSSRSPLTSLSPPAGRGSILPPTAFYEEYVMKPRSENSGQESRESVEDTPPLRRPWFDKEIVPTRSGTTPLPRSSRSREDKRTVHTTE